MTAEFSITTARNCFPALKEDQVFLDNAGGSQVLGDVIDSISKYLYQSNVQLGGSYRIGKQAIERYASGYKAAAQYVNAKEDEIVIGASTTQLLLNLAVSLNFNAGDEIILSKIDHEANIDPWLHMAKRLNLSVKWWVPEGPKYELTAENLKPLISEKTKFVACTHVSNILGTIHDVRGISEVVHEAGALFAVDGVSFAPHRRVDVKALGVDFYAFSWYKVYGPHIALLYASTPAQRHISSLGHYFNPHTSLSDKLDLAASNYELVQSIPLIVSYLGGSKPDPAFSAIAEHEEKLQKILLDYLNSDSRITVWGEKSGDREKRVPTISFTVAGVSSKKVVEDVERTSNIGMKWGHFYSHRLCTEMLQLGEEGVVRVSMVHYNTEEEVRKVVEVLEKVLRN